jgi:hypothetical protein
MMDVVIRLTPMKRPDADVSFRLTFPKARLCTPETRTDFSEVQIALIKDAWTCNSGPMHKLDKTATKFLESLEAVLVSDKGIMFDGRLVATMEAWRLESAKRGLIKPETKPNSARALFSKYRRMLVDAGYVQYQEDYAWPIS